MLKQMIKMGDISFELFIISQAYRLLSIFCKINCIQLFIVHIRSMSGSSEFRLRTILREKKVSCFDSKNTLYFHMIITGNPYFQIYLNFFWRFQTVKEYPTKGFICYLWAKK